MTPTTPLRILVADLLKRVGSQRAVAVSTTLGDLGTPVVLVTPHTAVAVRAQFERIAEGIVVRGTITTTWEAVCARCLAPTAGDLVVGVDELFEPEPIAGETYLLDGETLDLEPLVRDAIVLELPHAPLCHVDCAGLCPECGVDRNTTECDCAPDQSDPRWAALGSLEL